MFHLRWMRRYATEVLFPARASLLRQVAEHDSSWDRFRRYATWMRRLLLDREDNEWMTDDTFNHILTGSPDGFVCPTLHHLTCYLTGDSVRFISHFLSPHLTHLTIRLRLFDIFSGDPSQNLGPALRILQTSRLQEVFIDLGQDGTDHIRDEVASMIQRCGHLLRVLSVPVPLGEAETHHIMGLENLRVWDRVCSPPPTAFPVSTTFPPLQALGLSNVGAYGWIPWLTQRERDISDTYDGSVEYAGLRSTLARLNFQEPVPISATFISPLFFFPNLVDLYIRSNCFGAVGCVFSLTNQDVVQLSAALPRLEQLDFGAPCHWNACRTTISCFLALSVRCKGLSKLKIHFNTTNLAGDIRSLSEDPNFHELRSLPTRCLLQFFSAGRLPLPPGISNDDITTIATGLIDIFPSLRVIISRGGSGWDQLHARVCELRGIPAR